MADQKIVRIVSAECGTCESWAVGVGCDGDPSQGRCTNYYSPCHNALKSYEEGCQVWVPMDRSLAEVH